MPEWVHTHDVHWRGATFPVFSVTTSDLTLLYRADGGIEWIKSKLSGMLMYRGITKRDAVLKVSRNFVGQLPEVHLSALGAATRPAITTEATDAE